MTTLNKFFNKKLFEQILNEAIHPTYISYEKAMEYQKNYDTAFISSNNDNPNGMGAIMDRDSHEFKTAQKSAKINLQKAFQRFLNKYGIDTLEIYPCDGIFPVNDKAEYEPSLFIIDFNFSGMLKQVCTEASLEFDQHSFYFKKRGGPAQWYMICRNDENVQHKVQTLGPLTQFTKKDWDVGETYRSISNGKIDSDSPIEYGTMFGYEDEGKERLGVSDFADNPQVSNNTKEIDKLVKDAERREKFGHRMIDKNHHTDKELVQKFLDSKAKNL
jgi:hypothetical protein